MRIHALHFVLISAVTLLFGVALAADDFSQQRHKLMYSNGMMEGKVNNVILGKFLPDNARKALQTMETNIATFVTLFPDGADRSDPDLKPEIWANLEDVKAIADKTIADLKAAEDSLAEGQKAFTLAWQVASASCDTCHDKYSALP